jgi:dolichol-phosphate mannosyltransferase
MLSGVLMMMLGVIGEYLWRSYHETRRLPNFVVDTVVATPEDGDSAPAEP